MKFEVGAGIENGTDVPRVDEKSINFTEARQKYASTLTLMYSLKIS